MACGGCQKAKAAAGKAVNIAKGFTALATGKKYEFTAGRIRRCQKCDKNYWVGRLLFCSVCKCFIPAKATIKDETCPLDRWPDIKGVLKDGE